MLIDLQQPLRNIYGEPELCEDQLTPVTLAALCLSMLLAPDPAASTDAALTGPQKLARMLLAQRIAEAPPGGLDLKLDDLHLLKDLVSLHPYPLVVGRLLAVLEV